MTLPSTPALPPGVPGEVFSLEGPGTGKVAGYAGGPAPVPGGPAPLVLVHSVNAAACAFEVRPVFEHFARARPVFALDLPGFGLSERSDRPYTPRVMTDAVKALVAEVRRRCGSLPVDALGLSLGSEFVVRAAAEEPAAYRSLALVSPTGFDGLSGRRGPPGSTRAIPGLHGVLKVPLWGPGLFGLLTRPKVVRYFLERTFGQPRIDEALWEYDVKTVRQPGAHHAPLAFLGGGLFSNDITALHEALTMPVWLAHGIRGDFVDYQGAAAMRTRPNWRFDVFQTGAMPFFEVKDAFLAAYERFLEGKTPAA